MLPIWEEALAKADEMTVRNALDALASLGPAAVPRLIESLKHEAPRIHVVYILGQIGPDAAPATEALAKLIVDEDELVAEEAVLALAKIGPGAKAAVPALVEALQSGSHANPHAVAYALGKIGPSAAEAEPVLTKSLKSDDPLMAVASAWALAHVAKPTAELAAQVVPPLTAGLASPVAVARQGAAEALGKLGPEANGAVEALEEASKDEDAAVREAATVALKSIRG
jgi:HEAT repeat protein